MNIPIPPVGWRVHFFLEGDTTNPLPGDVISVGQWVQKDKMPVIALNYQQKNSAVISYARTVRHKNDPFLKDHGDLRKFNITGTWDYIPGLVPPPLPFPEPPAEAESKQEKKSGKPELVK
jgi:hypothetical protein